MSRGFQSVGRALDVSKRGLARALTVRDTAIHRWKWGEGSGNSLADAIGSATGTNDGASWVGGDSRTAPTVGSSITSISGDPTGRHNFNPATRETIVQVDLEIDGAVRPYVAYDSNQPGDRISLYYTDDPTGSQAWTPYSGNPILSGSTQYRWASTVVDSSGTLHMFSGNINAGGDIDRYTSTDGINFTLQETVATADGGTSTPNPYVWKDSQSGDWVLYYQNGTNPSTVHFRQASSITGLTSASDQQVFSAPQGYAGPAPSVGYWDGRYWMFNEGHEGGDSSNPWVVRAYYGDSLTGPWTEASDSPVNLETDSAVPFLFDNGGGDWWLTYQYDSTNDNWYSRHRDVNEGSSTLESTASYVGDYALEGDGSSANTSLTTLGTFGSSMTSDFSVTFTISGASGATESYLGVVNSGDSTSLLIGNGGTSGAIRFWVRDASGNELQVITSGGLVDDGNLHRVACVKTGNTASDMSVWVDGTEYSTTINKDQAFGDPTDFDIPVWTHGRNFGTPNYSAVVIDEPMFDDVALTADQIQNDYARQPWS